MWRWLAHHRGRRSACSGRFPGIGDHARRRRSRARLPRRRRLCAVGALIVSGLLYGPEAEPDDIERCRPASLAAYLFAAAVPGAGEPARSASRSIVFALLVAATVAIAWRTEAAAAAVPVAALLAALVMLHWAVESTVEYLIAPCGPVAGAVPEPERARYRARISCSARVCARCSAAPASSRKAARERADRPMLWAAAAVFAPLAILVALYYRIDGFERSIPFAGARAAARGAVRASRPKRSRKREPRPGLAAAAAIFATGAIAALALALTFALEKGWLTVALALMVPGIAWVSEQRPLPALRWLAAVIVALVMARIGWEPRIVGGDVGTTPIFNWLLYGYGMPALCVLARRPRCCASAPTIAPARMVDARRDPVHRADCASWKSATTSTAATSTRARAGLTEVALQVCVWLAHDDRPRTHLRVRTGSVVHDIGAHDRRRAGARRHRVRARLSRKSAADRPTGRRPVLQPDPARLRHAGRAGGRARAASRAATRPHALCAVAAVVAVVLALAYLTLEVRTLFHGPVLTRGPTTDAEQYTYSAVWLAFGVVLLLVGILLQSQPVRLASAAVVHPHRRQGVPARHGGPDRRLARAVLHRPRAGADRDRLALSAAAVSAPAPPATPAA